MTNNLIIINALYFALVLSTSALDAFPTAAQEQGRRLFFGLDELQGTIQNDGIRLPPEYIKCIKCHSAPAQISNSFPNKLSGSLILSSETLLEKKVRRGGPAFKYSVATFCNTLRSGSDPTGIILEFGMPRFSISDRQCGALWIFINK